MAPACAEAIALPPRGGHVEHERAGSPCSESAPELWPDTDDSDTEKYEWRPCCRGRALAPAWAGCYTHEASVAPLVLVPLHPVPHASATLMPAPPPQRPFRFSSEVASATRPNANEAEDAVAALVGFEGASAVVEEKTAAATTPQRVRPCGPAAAGIQGAPAKVEIYGRGPPPDRSARDAPAAALGAPAPLLQCCDPLAAREADEAAAAERRRTPSGRPTGDPPAALGAPRGRGAAVASVPWLGPEGPACAAQGGTLAREPLPEASST